MVRSNKHVVHIGQFIALAAGLAAVGCAGPVRQRAVPPELQDRAAIAGMPPTVRTWGAAVNPEFQQELIESVRREQAHLASSGQAGGQGDELSNMHDVFV